mmetsp:Transcript_15924/g.43690  ORF Transcript_15924/g.43690 Transcript_15924/m.43690 type:complete len:263 (-) Transcript_15924:1101-1889(-)
MRSTEDETLLADVLVIVGTHPELLDLRTLQLPHDFGHLLKDTSNCHVQLVEASAIEGTHEDGIWEQLQQVVDPLLCVHMIHLGHHIDPRAFGEPQSEHVAHLHLFIQRQEPLSDWAGVEGESHGAWEVLHGPEGKLVHERLVLGARMIPQARGVNDLPVNEQRRASDKMPQVANSEFFRRVAVRIHLRAPRRYRPHEGRLPNVGRTHERHGGLVEVDRRRPYHGALRYDELFEDWRVLDDEVEHVLDTLVRDECSQASALSL